MPMKYKLALCVVALLAVTAAAFADVSFYTEKFDETTAKLPAYSLQRNWAIATPVKGPSGPTAAFSSSADGARALVYNLNGNYEPNISPPAYAQTTAIDCTGKIGVKLTFMRWLGVEDSNYDQATIWVSNDNVNWTRVYLNPTHKGKDANGVTIYDGDVVDTAWVKVTYDISGVADNKKTVYVRWGIASNGTDQLAGWSIDDVTLTSTTADAPYPVVTPTGVSTLPSGLVATNADGTADTAIWKVGGATAGGGQTQMVGTPPVSTLVGPDPATNSAGVAGETIIGTVIGGNYPSSMPLPVYLTWGPMDLRGYNNTALAFMRWLQVEDSKFDRARIEIGTNDTVPDDGDGILDSQQIFADTSSSTVKAAVDPAGIVFAGTVPKAYNIPTTGYFFTDIAAGGNVAKVLQVTYTSTGLVVGESVAIQYTLDITKVDKDGKPAVVWATLTTDDKNAQQDADKNLIPVKYVANGGQAAGQLPVGAADNKNFAVRVLLTYNGTKDSPSKAAVAISLVKLMGVKWTVIWQNPTAGTAGTTNTFDDKWKQISYDLSKLADNQRTVYIRWSIGPTDIFPEGGPDTSNYGGWSMDTIQLSSGSRVWSFVSESVPASLLWDTTGSVKVTAKNAGGALWDSTYKLYTVEGNTTKIADLGNPGKTKTVVALDTTAAPVDRWGISNRRVSVSGTVAADQTTTFSPTVTAPPLTSIVYTTPVVITLPADSATADTSDISLLNCHWDMASKTPKAAIDFLPTYMNGSIANAGIQISRFPDVQAGQAGYWARYYIEELAGRSPMVVTGFPGTPPTYRPTVNITRDQIAVFIARAANLAITAPSGAIFHDIGRDYWAAAWIEACARTMRMDASQGKLVPIVSGYPDGSYQPLGNITRDGMAKLIALGAGFTILTAPAVMDYPAGWKTGDPPGWFSDVQVVDDTKTTDVDERNIFRDYINTLWVKKVVQGFGDDAHHPTYRPALNVTRDQLAVYIWRAFMRDSASLVVVGGPGITAVNAVEPATYYGYSSAPTLVQGGDQYYAYLTLDAVRLAGLDLSTPIGGAALDVSFKLKDSFGVSSPTFMVSVPMATLQQWAADVSGPDATGEPYRNIALAIPTSVVTQGDYKLIVNVEGNELARQTKFAVVGNVFSENFESDPLANQWILYGQPAPIVNLYPAVLSDPSKGVTDLFRNNESLQLQNTQTLVRAIDTTNLNNLNVSAYVAAIGLGSSDTVTIDWSPDYATKLASATWVNVYKGTGSAVPAKLTQIGPFNLPNGTDTTVDPKVYKADNNPFFAIRVSVNCGTSTPRVYFDDLVLRGS